MNLEQALKKASYKVWDELEPVTNPSHIVSFAREEALTSMALKELSNSHCASIDTIRMITPSVEKVRGYDFELAIGSKQIGKYIRFFIQSKRLYGNSINSTYDAIHFSQTEKLIKYSKQEKSLATYAFYNNLYENDLVLADYYNSATAFDMKAIGITLASAYSVKQKNCKDFLNYHFNHGFRVPPSVYSLKSFHHLFFFYGTHSHLSVPLHELSYLTIELAELINKEYRLKERKNILPLLLLLFPGLLDGDEELIPILKTDVKQLTSDFTLRATENLRNVDFYSPQGLVIMHTS